MSSDVTANSRTVVHKGDGIVNVSALPDVCKTPTPAGPTPVPYPNVARSSDLADGAKHVTIEGNPVALENSKLSQSSGDEAGTLGGVVSGKNRGKMTWGTSSPDVCVEGKGVIRFADLTHHNCNSYNVIELNDGSQITVVVYGDDAKCPICEKEAPSHKVLPDQTDKNRAALDAMDNLVKALEKGAPFYGMFNDRWRDTPMIIKNKGRMLATVTCKDCDVVVAAMSGNPSEMPQVVDPRNGQAKAQCKTCVQPKSDPDVKPKSWKSQNERSSDMEVFITVASKCGYKTYRSRSVCARCTVGARLKMNLDSVNPKRGLLSARRFAWTLDGLTEFLNASNDSLNSNKGVADCAAPKALALALELKHRPHTMCERVYVNDKVASGLSGALHRFNGWEKFLGRGPAGRSNRIRSVSYGEMRDTSRSAPSCSICKLQVPALLCNFPDGKCEA